MRQITQISNKKPKNSKFFDYFTRAHGEVCTRAVGEDEIQRNMKTFYLDVAFGNIQQEKYLQYFLADERILQIAIRDCNRKCIFSYNRLASLQFARTANAQFSLTDEFVETMREEETIYNTYSTILSGLQNFAMTGQLQYLTAVSITFNNPMHRGSKSVLL